MSRHIAFGIDIGGSGIKGAPVDLDTGEFTAERVRIPTPEHSTPQAVAQVVADLVNSFDLPAKTPIGVAFPAPIHHGVVPFIANLDKSFTGVNLTDLIKKATGHDAVVINDADAAGYAEQQYGAAENRDGTILVITLGTGIGSALICNGTLVPNTEFGHLEIDGKNAEKQAADSARERENLSMDQWAKRLQRYFDTVDMLLSPDLIVVGGGISKKYKEFLPLIHSRSPIVPAKLFNSAGIVGAAAYAAAETKHRRQEIKKQAKDTKSISNAKTKPEAAPVVP